MSITSHLKRLRDEFVCYDKHADRVAIGKALNNADIYRKDCEVYVQLGLEAGVSSYTSIYVVWFDAPLRAELIEEIL